MLITSIISKDDKELFDYFVRHYPKLILPSGNSDNPLFSLLETTKNNEYFFNELMKNKMDLYKVDKYGMDLKYYAKIDHMDNLQNKLVGRITIDDIVDIIKEEADKDFQMASGISDKIESNSSVWHISRARLPWLLIGMLGGIFAANVISKFTGEISDIPTLALFIPLITAMGGNVGVQSSAIVVQALAKGNIKFENISRKIAKETLVGLLNGAFLASIIYGIATFYGNSTLGFVVSISLFVVIVFAGIFGTLIPLILNKYKIDPALATGPFVTTLNDVLGLFIYFSVGALLYSI